MKVNKIKEKDTQATHNLRKIKVTNIIKKALKLL